MEALGRPADFDPSTNSSVRVEMHRLRARLRKYYETEGEDHALRIMVMDGRYELQFVRREDGLAAAAGKGEGNGHSPAAGKNWLTRKTVAIAAVFVVLLLITSWVLVRARSHQKQDHAGAVPAISVAATSSIAGDGSVRILAGYTKGQYLDRDGNPWGGDRYFSGGEVVDLKLPYIQGTADPTMFRTARVGEFSYNIPMKPGNYELRLHFVETALGREHLQAAERASRVFSVSLGDQPLLSSFDILSDAGGNFRAFTRVFNFLRPAMGWC